jgi:hypothetical protein
MAKVAKVKEVRNLAVPPKRKRRVFIECTRESARKPPWAQAKSRQAARLGHPLSSNGLSRCTMSQGEVLTGTAGIPAGAQRINLGPLRQRSYSKRD